MQFNEKRFLYLASLIKTKHDISQSMRKVRFMIAHNREFGSFKASVGKVEEFKVLNIYRT